MTSALARFRSFVASPLPGVLDTAWEKFLYALDTGAPIGATSPSGGLGSFDLRPRRLAELGLMSKLSYARGAPGKREICVGEFVPPMTRERFLSDVMVQNDALIASMVAYDEDLTTGELVRPEGLSRAGALAILHRGGRGALTKWPEMFDDTAALVARCEGCF